MSTDALQQPMQIIYTTATRCILHKNTAQTVTRRFIKKSLSKKILFIFKKKYLLGKRASKQYTTACHAAATTMLGRNKQEIFNYRRGVGRALALSIGATPVVVIVYVIHSSNTNNINITFEHAP